MERQKTGKKSIASSLCTNRDNNNSYLLLNWQNEWLTVKRIKPDISTGRRKRYKNFSSKAGNTDGHQKRETDRTCTDFRYWCHGHDGTSTWGEWSKCAVRVQCLRWNKTIQLCFQQQIPGSKYRPVARLDFRGDGVRNPRKRTFWP